MKLLPALTARLEFLSRVIHKECAHLLNTDRRLFDNLFTVEEAQKIENDPILAERLDAFVSRFGRLQDTVGDKLHFSFNLQFASRSAFCALSNFETQH